jgi:thioester reductase-like protein
MNYFQKYEKLKATNQLLTPGSIWIDNIGKVKINYITVTHVFFQCLTSTLDNDYVKSDFLRHFRRYITD